MSLPYLFDLSHTSANNLLKQFTYPWEALPHLNTYILQLRKSLNGAEYEELAPSVWVHKSATVSQSAYLGAPCIIGAETNVRHGAFIRGSALVGENCVVGNSTELKNAILFDGVQVPHFNYVGDSILGYKSHLGAGVILSNVKSDKSPVTVRGNGTILTGLKKLGSVVDDFAEIGCNSVLNPGTVVGANTTVYPLSCVRGVIPADSIYKSGGIISAKR